MIQTTTIRLDSELMSQFESLCRKFGTNINSAFDKLVRTAIKSKSLGFAEESEDEIRREGREAFHRLRRQAEGLEEMTLEEINAEIEECRRERKC